MKSVDPQQFKIMMNNDEENCHIKLLKKYFL